MNLESTIAKLLESNNYVFCIHWRKCWSVGIEERNTPVFPVCLHSRLKQRYEWYPYLTYLCLVFIKPFNTTVLCKLTPIRWTYSHYYLWFTDRDTCKVIQLPNGTVKTRNIIQFFPVCTITSISRTHAYLEEKKVGSILPIQAAMGNQTALGRKEGSQYPLTWHALCPW